jgi:hypothetical protein
MSKGKSKRKCVYCGRSTKLTREHVCPDFLDKMMFPHRSFAFIGGANKLAITEVKIRDVCADCNSGVLAQLDAYGKELAARYFKNIVDDVTVRFEYDYGLLLRWLLKVLYNASRAYKSPSHIYEAYVPYIMGESPEPPKTALLVGVWKPSFYKGSLYYPTDVRFSVLTIPDKPYTGLLLTSMFSVRSYAFIVLGWEDQARPNEIAQTITFVSQQFGATLLEKDDNQAFLNPAVSRLDYISSRMAQIHTSPWMLTEPSEKMKQRIPEAKAIPVDPLPTASRFYTKVAITTFDEPRIAAFAMERLHPGLIVEEVSVEEPTQVSANPRASARITREGQKTYIDIIDHYELDEPFGSGDLGIYQSEANWEAWRDAIRDDDDWLYISTLSPDNDPHKMRLVSKIKVLSISEQ